MPPHRAAIRQGHAARVGEEDGKSRGLVRHHPQQQASRLSLVGVIKALWLKIGKSIAASMSLATIASAGT